MILVSICSLNGYAKSISTETLHNELDSIVTDICNKKIVLLGEDANHGSGKTMEVKIALIKRLIEECKFSAVFFESPVYEFLNFEHSVAKGSSSKHQLAEAIGGLWSNAKPMTSFISYLHSRAIVGKVKLAGIDAQFGANQPFSQKKLPKRLSSYLGERKQKECEAELYQYLNWQYDKENPYDDATQERISSCVSVIKDRIHQHTSSDSEYIIDKFMVDNFNQYQQFSKGDYFNLRDKVMADNIDWHLSKLPKNSKVIVWCATIHAAKTLSPLSIDKIPVGLHLKESLKDQMASIGFSALSGSFGRSKSKIKNIKQTPMELKALSKSTNEISYFDAKALDDLGEIEAQAIQYNSIKLANWSKILDGIIILRHEKPIELVK